MVSVPCTKSIIEELTSRMKMTNSNSQALTSPGHMRGKQDTAKCTEPARAANPGALIQFRRNSTQCSRHTAQAGRHEVDHIGED